MEKKKVLDFDVVIEQDEEGYYYAYVPELPGCHTQSEKVEDIIPLIRDAISVYLEVNPAPSAKESSPKFIGVQRVSVSV